MGNTILSLICLITDKTDTAERTNSPHDFVSAMSVQIPTTAGRKLSGDISCTQCNYSTNSQTKYEEHLKAHRGRFICKLCSKAFIKVIYVKNFDSVQKDALVTYSELSTSCLFVDY